MRTHAGVWIDHRSAIVVILADGKSSTATIASQTEKPSRTSGGSHQREPWAHQSVVAEDHRDREYRHALTRFYEAVGKAIARADDLYLVGSGEARKELLHYLEEHDRFTGRVRESKPAQEMTEAEMVAETRRFYHLPMQEAS
ncbi:hypothetical protein EDC38_1685 [Marinimicrobium koreense]|uniref:Host attachment protein n=1 Tax=Marinimicrobium koreense TaxID=306545 RepID=A0A3N1NMW9_9GAMM|nr:hypothetical protein [Marinimicrobium koreense]ROQ21064.1 hypothetical protein EDC38_1685 [Marinimicrobium koreense]